MKTVKPMVPKWIHLRLSLLIFLGFLGGKSQCQSFLEGRVVWHVRAYRYTIDPPQRTYKHSLKYALGDTSIFDGRPYRSLQKTTYEDSTHWEEVGYFYEDDATILFRELNGEVYLYALKEPYRVGDPFHDENGSYCNFDIMSVDTLINQGRPHRRIHLIEHRGSFEVDYVENVGFLDHFSEYKICTPDLGEFKIRCVVRNDTLVYKKEDGQPCSLPSEQIIDTQVDVLGSLPVAVSPTLLSVGQSVLVSAEQGVRVRVHDFSGRCIHDDEGKIFEIPMMHAGVYHLWISKGSEVMVKRVVVQ